MRKNFVLLVHVIILSIILGVTAYAGEPPKPFGLTIGKTTYAQALETLQQRKWNCQEYVKKQLKLIDKKDPNRGKNTFLFVNPKDTEGVKNIMIFFDGNSALDALIVDLDPKLFYIIWEEMDKKYEFVSKHLEGDYFSSDYPRILWQKENVYIELQKVSPHHARLVYVEKLLYENYKDFLQKTYEPYRRKKSKKDWMDDL
ncbi:MAG: hypothetical protein JRF17_04160 [Deltaproteobacteria bacterium]|jgi:hypothetical protein|nr:hypothetical protein [Deltaproteobacteria bacterium]MBW2491155.1 hypothetical protein [Deltaproteobacteria bacterium]